MKSNLRLKKGTKTFKIWNFQKKIWWKWWFFQQIRLFLAIIRSKIAEFDKKNVRMYNFNYSSYPLIGKFGFSKN